MANIVRCSEKSMFPDINDIHSLLMQNNLIHSVLSIKAIMDIITLSTISSIRNADTDAPITFRVLILRMRLGAWAKTKLL